MQTLFSREPIDSDFKDRLNDKLMALEPSETAAGPGEAFAAVEQMIHAASDSATTVYLVSDFRAKDWTNAAGLRKAMLELNASGAQLQLIDCVDAERPNLSLSVLQPGLGIRAAGVPLKMEVGVTNYGPQTARDVSVQLAEDGRARPAVTIAVDSAGANGRRPISKFAITTRASIRSPPGCRPMPSRPITPVIRCSIFRKTCRCW